VSVRCYGKYAENHGFTIVRTHSLRGAFWRRKGIQELTQDVVQRRAYYKAILVYDVSRWGRFQDTNESALYEFLCRSWR